MKKLKLNLDDLQVQSFDTLPDAQSVQAMCTEHASTHGEAICKRHHGTGECTKSTEWCLASTCRCAAPTTAARSATTASDRAGGVHRTVPVPP